MGATVAAMRATFAMSMLMFVLNAVAVGAPDAYQPDLSFRILIEDRFQNRIPSLILL